ncbi:hypothetical protein [Roseiconus lacunae]|uniref:hypothetical protein n=1 Tax=Roseiconus lacunae TaxID=2605694 RepID=UPI0011F10E27|nr:hypothetical protein [Roseiconus lacunae]
MDLSFRYRRRSTVDRSPAGLAIALAPNLRRDRVSYRGELIDPLRFREAIGALHDIVISDLRYQPRDRSAYQAYREQQSQRESEIRRQAYRGRLSELKRSQPEPMPDGLEPEYQSLRKKYWRARRKYSSHLLKHDRELWRYLMPCDPIVTVAPDTLLFECFSADESSYGCLSVDREAFRDESDVSLGTTNVDYTWQLYEHFQTLRSYRQTRFEIDPQGFGVSTSESGGHLEEKIDLPNSWLRGLMQLQSAMSLPMKRINVSREALYNLLAFLKRNRAKQSPRAMRIECHQGQPPQIVLEPWEKAIPLPPQSDVGETSLSVRLWGRDRLQVLSRLLPMIDSTELYVQGTGLPSFWVIRMGNLRLTLALSGWTNNDWTGSSALSQLAAPVDLSERMLTEIAAAFKDSPSQTFDRLCQTLMYRPVEIAAGLNRLALLGQVIHDLPGSVYRWRQVMPAPLTMEQLGGDDPETEAARKLVSQGRIRAKQTRTTESGLVVIEGNAGGRDVELMIDGDGRIVRGSCRCSHHFKNALRMGPCRHLQAVRDRWTRQASGDGAGGETVESWYQRFWN